MGRGEEGGRGEAKAASRKDREDPVSSRDKATFSTFERSAGHRTSE